MSFDWKASTVSALDILRFFTVTVGLFPSFAQSPGPVTPRLVHAFEALADNKFQGIVPVPAALGNGDDAAHNLSWGTAFGVHTFFRKSSEWTELSTLENPDPYILERTIFLHAATGTYLVADAYRGRGIKRAILDLYGTAAGGSDRDSFKKA